MVNRRGGFFHLSPLGFRSKRKRETGESAISEEGGFAVTDGDSRDDSQATAKTLFVDGESAFSQRLQKLVERFGDDFQPFWVG